MGWVTEQDETAQQATGAGRFGARTAVGLGALALAAMPFLVLLLVVQSSWAPLKAFDGDVAASLNEQANDSSVLLTAAEAVTHLGGVAFATYSFLLATAFLWLRGQRRYAAFAGVTGAGLGILVPVTKDLVDRARPVVGMPVVEAPTSASFPSGHAMVAIVMWGALLLLTLPLARRWVRPWLLVTAILLILAVGLSRLVLGVHFASDVVAGWSLGAAWLAVTASSFRAWQRDEGRRPAGVSAGLGVVDRPEGVPLPTAEPRLRSRRAIVVGLSVWAGVLLVAVIGTGLLVTGPLSDTALGRLSTEAARAVVSYRTETRSDLAAWGSSLAGLATVPALTIATAALGLAATGSWRPAVFAATSVAGSSAIYLVASNVVGRARPDVPDLTSGLPPGTSWPSGHAAAAVTAYGAIAALLMTYWRRVHTYALVAAVGAVALVVSLSRLYVSAHYVTDVLAGLGLGLAWLLVCVRHLLRGSDGRLPRRATAQELQ